MYFMSTCRKAAAKNPLSAAVDLFSGSKSIYALADNFMPVYLRVQQSPPISSATPITPSAKTEENSRESSSPAPNAIKAVPSNSFFLHIKTAPCYPMRRRRLKCVYFVFDHCICRAGTCPRRCRNYQLLANLFVCQTVKKLQFCHCETPKGSWQSRRII